MVKVSHYKLQNGSVLVQWKLLPNRRVAEVPDPAIGAENVQL